MSAVHVLIIDDEPDIREMISEILSDEGYRVSTADSGRAAEAQLSAGHPDLVLLDIWMPDIDGISLLKQWQQQGQTDFPVVMMSGHGTIETAIEATRLGARDFIEKPISLARLLQTIDEAIKQHKTQQGQHPQSGEAWDVLEPMGNSQASTDMRDVIEKLSSASTNVCFWGETGTGKLTLALLLHKKRHGAESALAVMDCLSLNEHNAQSRFEETVATLKSSDQSSLILTNLDCLTLDLQQSLHALLKHWRMGSASGVGMASARSVFSTSQRDIKALIEQGEFCRELFDLTGEIYLYVSALSERAEDVPELLNYYINHLPDQENTRYRKMSYAAQNFLRGHHWSGNIRELKNLIRQLQLLGEDGEIQLDEVRDYLARSSVDGQATSNSTRYDLALREAREEFEKDYLMHHLNKVQGKVGDLAKIVGMERTHLYRKLRSLGINPKNHGKS